MKRVWVNGTFDILRPGHLDILQYAAIHGRLRVGVDSDERVKLLKGTDHPLFSLANRVRMLKSLRFVDEVVTFGSDEDLRLAIGKYSPYYIVVGAEHEGSAVVGAELCKEVLFFPRTLGFSTSHTLQ